ncbi:MAG: 50S ribosomal protein L4 [Candidatus Pacebacteria bacterium]|nr:50S ribosomal protein L4 [Candidatus Paceibacterota bacterium]
METKIYNQKGKEAGTIALPEAIFGLPWNADLVYQVVNSLRSSHRDPIAHTKTRGEVRGGGRKPWQQKGLGKARHGSIRSPIWVGGGVTHGPRNDKNYDRKVNKQAKSKALNVILSKKFRDNEILFLDNLALENPKTKEAKAVVLDLATIKGFEKLATKPKNAAIIAMNEKGDNAVKGFNNFGNIAIEEYRNINPLMALNCKYLVIAGANKIFAGVKAEAKAEAKKEEKAAAKAKPTTEAKSVKVGEKIAVKPAAEKKVAKKEKTATKK